jgi:hypothetical protein
MIVPYRLLYLNAYESSIEIKLFKSWEISQFITSYPTENHFEVKSYRRREFRKLGEKKYIMPEILLESNAFSSSICAVPGLEEKHSGEDIHSDIIIFRYFIQTQ